MEISREAKQRAIKLFMLYINEYYFEFYGQLRNCTDEEFSALIDFLISNKMDWIVREIKKASEQEKTVIGEFRNNIKNYSSEYSTALISILYGTNTAETLKVNR